MSWANSGLTQMLQKSLFDHPGGASERLQPEITQARVIIGTAAKRPVIFPLALLDREVVYTGNAPAH
jgi:hypothetical protein